MRWLPCWFLLSAACVAPQLVHSCPTQCAVGQSCDIHVGECKDDPCNGRCTGSLRCVAGPPPHCTELGVGEARIAVPGEPTGPAEPPATPQTAPAAP